MKSRVAAFVCISLMSLGPAFGVSYTGTLSSQNNEIDGREGWINPGPTIIEWTVTENLDSSWHYQYILTVPSTENDISHFIIEASDGFSTNDIFNQTGQFSTVSITTHLGNSSGNPSMPEDIYGIKFDDTSGTTLSIDFDSWRIPVWGDFYAKCGGNPANEAWNMGFGSPDSDPTSGPMNGSIDSHILVPDTYVPEPSSIFILALGAILVRKRTAT